MIKTRILAAAAVASLAVAPVAAQAGTRAESSPVAIDASRASAPVAGQSDIGHFSPTLILLLLAIIAAIIAAAKGGRSRG